MFRRLSRRAFWWFPAGALIVATAISAAAQTPAGAQFQVNTYTTRRQEQASVAMGANGAFVVVWQSEGSSGTDDEPYSIQGQRYAAGGSPQGGEFQVNTFTVHFQRFPSVAMDADGDFVAVWESTFSDPPVIGQWNIHGQRFASNGTAQGPLFLVNSYPDDGEQYRPSVAMAADGDFIVVWHSREGSPGTDSSFDSVQGQRFASNGSTLGSQFQVNTYTTNVQFRASVAAAPDGDFVVVWHSSGSFGTDSSSSSIQGQRYASDGSTQGGEFQVNTYTSLSVYHPSVALAGDGGFVVSWMGEGSPGTDSSGWSIQARRFASDGAALGSQLQVNTYTPNMQWFPAVAAAANGDFIVVWSSEEPAIGPAHYQIQAQRFAADGSAQGAQFRVNTNTHFHWYPTVAMTSNAEFVVAWEDYGSDTDTSDIQGQRFAQGPVEVPLFSLTPRIALVGSLFLLGAWYAQRRRSATSQRPAEKP